MTRILRCSYLSGKALNAFLVSTPMKGLGNVLVAAELQTGIAADILVGICGAETSYGSRGYATDKSFNNLTDWGIGDVTKTSEAQFKSFSECLTNTALWLKQRFLDPTNWRYKKAVAAKLGPTSLEGVALNYASDKNWAKNVLACRADLMKRQPEDVCMKQYAGGFLFNEPVDWSNQNYLVVGYALWKYDGKPR